MVWRPQGYAKHGGHPPPWSGGAVGLAQVCFCPGAGEAHTVPVILSGAVLGHISALEHSGPAEVGSCSCFLPSARLALVTSPGHTRGPLPTLVQDLEGFPLFAIICVAPLGDALPRAKLLMPQFPPPSWTHPSPVAAPTFDYGDMPSPLSESESTITVLLRPAQGRGAPIR